MRIVLLGGLRWGGTRSEVFAERAQFRPSAVVLIETRRALLDALAEGLNRSIAIALDEPQRSDVKMRLAQPFDCGLFSGYSGGFEQFTFR